MYCLLWRYRKHWAQATRARKGDLAGVTQGRQRQSFERMHTMLTYIHHPYIQQSTT